MVHRPFLPRLTPAALQAGLWVAVGVACWFSGGERPSVSAPLSSRRAARADSGNDDWSMPRHDPLASAAAANGPRPPLHVAWQRKLPVYSQLLAVGGRVIFVSGGFAVALDGGTGEVAWKTRLPDVREDGNPPLSDGGPFGWRREQQLRSPLALGGRVFFAVNTDLYALDARSGTLLWRRTMWDRWPPPEEIGYPPPRRRRVTPQSEEYHGGGFVTQWRGRLLVGTGRAWGHVLSLDPVKGRTIWQTPRLEPGIPAATHTPLRLTAPIISSSGTLYFSTEWTGRKHWEVAAWTGRRLRRSRLRPVAAGPGYLIEQANSAAEFRMAPGDRLHLLGAKRKQVARVRCVDAATGRSRWLRTLFDAPAGKLLAMEPEETTYAAGPRLLLVGTLTTVYDEYPHPNDPPGGRREIYALDPVTGRRLWRAELHGMEPSPSNVILAGSVVYALDYFGYGGFTAYAAATGRRLWEGELPDGPHFALTHGPAVSGSRLFAADEDQIWALDSGQDGVPGKSAGTGR